MLVLGGNPAIRFRTTVRPLAAAGRTMCLNVGCIPTKMFVYPASLAAAPREAARLGVDLSLDKVRWNELQDRIFGRIDAISESGRRYRADDLAHVDLYQEHVRFTGPRTLTTDSGVELTADRVVVAAGSRAVLHDVPGIGLPQVHTSGLASRSGQWRTTATAVSPWCSRTTTAYRCGSRRTSS
ncbi:pyruvate/2-oxoglutarate dehydrogenase complex dihydrolipoamide dehydrogenase (E3) component [Arthrobacter sp. UYNi723]